MGQEAYTYTSYHHILLYSQTSLCCGVGAVELPLRLCGPEAIAPSALLAHAHPPSFEDEFSDVEDETAEGARKYEQLQDDKFVRVGHFETENPHRFCITGGAGDCWGPRICISIGEGSSGARRSKQTK